MTEKYVIDAYAWVEYLIGSDKGNKIYTCAVTLAEIINKTKREGRSIETVYEILTSNSNIVDADEEISKETGILHAMIRKTRKDFGLADAYVLTTARKTGSKILTGNPHFRGIKEAILFL